MSRGFDEHLQSLTVNVQGGDGEPDEWAGASMSDDVGMQADMLAFRSTEDA